MIELLADLPDLSDVTIDDYEREMGTSRFVKEAGLETYFKEINQIPLLTPQQERELAICVRKGDPEAREKMAKSNLRLVVSIAKNYVDKFNKPKIHMKSSLQNGVTKILYVPPKLVKR